MRAALALLSCLACAAPAQNVVLAPQATVVAASPIQAMTPEPVLASTTAPSGWTGCVIKGLGESWGNKRVPFRVFTSRTELEPALIIAEPRSVHVAWHDFPRAGTRGRVMASFGGQSLVKLDGYTDLDGRRFQLTHRATVAADHIWVRSGRTVEIVGVDDDALVVSSETDVRAPKVVHAITGCDAVVYQPDTLPREPDEPLGAETVLLAQTAHLYDGPNGRQLMVLATDYEVATRVETNGGFVHVVSTTGALAFDAWIPKRDVSADRNVVGLGGIGSTGGCGCRGWARTATVLRETPLRIGASPSSAVVGAIENGARVEIVQTIKLDVPWISVRFISEEIQPSARKSFWIAESDVRYD